MAERGGEVAVCTRNAYVDLTADSESQREQEKVLAQGERETGKAPPPKIQVNVFQQANCMH